MSHYLFISDAAKEVKVESHVLRYWEEELHLPIKRNELGHRYYTEEDVDRFKEIKDLKERGLQLKAIKMILKDGKLDILPSGGGIKRESAALKEQGAVGQETAKQETADRAAEERGSVSDSATGQGASKTEAKELESAALKGQGTVGQETTDRAAEERGSVSDGATGQGMSKTEAKERESAALKEQGTVGQERQETTERADVSDSAAERGASKTEAKERENAALKGQGAAERKQKETAEERGSMPDSAPEREHEKASENVPEQRPVEPEEEDSGEEQKGLAIDIIGCRSPRVIEESKEDKSRRLQWLLQQLIRETLQENNGELCNQIRESVVKELDYQFRMQEEREELRDRRMAERDEEHYKKMDELLRKKSRKAFSIGGKKKKSAP